MKRLNSNQNLSLTDNTLSISNSNSVELPQHSLDASIRLDGSYVDGKTKDVKIIVEAYYDGKFVTSGLDIQLYWRGIRGSKEPENASTKWTLVVPNLDSDGVVTNVHFNEHYYLGDRLEVKCEISYKGLTTTAYTNLQQRINGDKVNITSNTEGVKITNNASEVEGVTYKNFNIDLSGALSKYIEKTSIIKPNVYRIPFINRNLQPARNDTENEPRFVLTHTPASGMGLLKIDFVFKGNVPDSAVIGTLPSNAPTPATLLESQMWVGNKSFSIWMNKNDRNIRITGVTAKDFDNQRLIFNVMGIFN